MQTREEPAPPVSGPKDIPDRWSIAVWAFFTLVVVAVKWSTEPTIGNVYNIYREAGLSWVEGRNVYDAHGYLYSPTAAVFFIPFQWTSFAVGGAMWRVANIAIFAIGIWHLGRSMSREFRPKFFFIASIVTVLLSWSAARHGQMTMTMAATMMFACVDIQHGKWRRAGFWLALAIVLKPLAVVLFLLGVAIYPRVRLSASLWLLGFLVIPFVTQEPAYVLQQYQDFPKMLVRANARQETYMYANMFSVFKSLSISVPLAGQMIIRVVLALATLLLAWRLRRRTDAIAVPLFTVASTYILLLGAGTENNTYSLIMPILGLVIAEGYLDRRMRPLVLGFGLVVLSLASSKIGKTFPDTILDFLKPLIAATVTVAIVLPAWRRERAVVFASD